MDDTTTPTGPRPSHLAATRSDPRATRTRERVHAAILGAAAEHDLAALGVAEICRRAGVHRVTFYKHWESLDDAASDAFADIVDRLAAVPESAIASAPDPRALAGAYRDALHQQLAELSDRRPVYRRLFADSSGAFARRLEPSVRARAQLAIDALHRTGVGDAGPARDTAATFLAGGIVASFARFAASDDDIAETARGILAQLPAWWPRADDPA